ncbi:MAG TPA: hypothetical protein VG889_16065 [Rhizomicrobium sp.]|nr:hypothetical protein [Rhizomicrobium sp.]
MIRVSAAIGLFTFALTTAAQADLVISTAPTSNVHCRPDGTCKAKAADAVLNVDQLQSLLASGDVKVKTKSSGIAIAAPLTWTSSNKLALDTQGNLSVDAPVVVEGRGKLTIRDRELLFSSAGRIDFWDTQSRLFIVNLMYNSGNGHYTLVRDLPSLAAGVAAHPLFGLFALTADYDAGPDGTYPGAVVPTTLTGGGFEGLNHTISNLSAGGGLFASTIQNSSLRDIHLANVNIAAGDNATVGALVGSITGVVTHVSAQGHLSAGANSTAAGLVGSVTGTIADVSAAVTVAAGSESCGAGLLGGGKWDEWLYVVSFAHATGDVSVGAKSVAGGLACSVQGKVTQSWASGNVSTDHTQNQHTLGGLIGSLYSDDLSNSYALGNVTSAGGRDWNGGLIGNVEAADVRSAYSIGTVQIGGAARDRIARVGAFFGRAVNITSAKDYFDRDTAGIAEACGSVCHGIIGLSDAALKTGLPNGFDPAIWGQSPSVNNGYPYLLANPPQ